MKMWSAPVSVCRFAAAALLVTAGIAVGATPSHQAVPSSDQVAPLPAPYQVDGYERLPYDGGTVGTEVVVVGFGRAPDLGSPDAGIPLPASEALEWMTLLGTRGWVHAARVKIERRCEYLCSWDGPEECRWVGLYSPQRPDDPGGIVAALPGRLALTGFTALEPAAVQQPGPIAFDPMASLEVTDTSATLLWDSYGAGMTFRATEWDAASGHISGLLGSDHGEDQRLEADDCAVAAYEWLLAADCGNFALLASGGEPLLVSLGEYNMPSVEPLARFEFAGSRHYVVRFGAKAQDVVGLVSGEPAGWRARFRPRDWAQIC